MNPALAAASTVLDPTIEPVPILAAVLPWILLLVPVLFALVAVHRDDRAASRERQARAAAAAARAQRA